MSHILMNGIATVTILCCGPFMFPRKESSAHYVCSVKRYRRTNCGARIPYLIHLQRWLIKGGRIPM